MILAHPPSHQPMSPSEIPLTPMLDSINNFEEKSSPGRQGSSQGSAAWGKSEASIVEIE